MEMGETVEVPLAPGEADTGGEAVRIGEAVGLSGVVLTEAVAAPLPLVTLDNVEDGVTLHGVLEGQEDTLGEDDTVPEGAVVEELEEEAVEESVGGAGVGVAPSRGEGVEEVVELSVSAVLAVEDGEPRGVAEDVPLV